MAIEPAAVFMCEEFSGLCRSVAERFSIRRSRWQLHPHNSIGCCSAMGPGHICESDRSLGTKESQLLATGETHAAHVAPLAPPAMTLRGAGVVLMACVGQ